MSQAAAREPGTASAASRWGSGSQHDETAGRCLKARGIKAKEVAYDPRFDSRDGAAEIARELLSSHVVGSSFDDVADGRLAKGLTDAFDSEYNDEAEFNIHVFKAMAQCFEAKCSRWKVEFFPPKKEWSKKDSRPCLMVITGRRRDDGKAKGEDRPGEASSPGGGGGDGDGDGRTTTTTTRAPSLRNKRKSYQVEEGTDAGAGSASFASFAPFVAHADHPSPSPHAAAFKGEQDAASAGDEDEEDDDDDDDDDKADEGKKKKTCRAPQRTQRTQYALGLAREARIPVQKEGIVENDSCLDHALVVLRRDASAVKRSGGPLGGWAICQVLATVGIKMIDSTCKEFHWATGSDTARIDASSIELSRTGGAGPLGQQVLYAFGHVLWGRAALGLELPPSLPVAVVAAKKARVATADPATRMRWVYGHLVIPEECGGAFSFNVSSCGAFDGTSAKSAVAVYLSVLMKGLAAGEQWIEKMQQKPPPSDDTRPWPSSMCGRQLYFGGSPLNLLDKKLVATPARMRKLDLPISQGELYKGCVNLEEIRNPSDGKTLSDVVWCPAKSEAPPVEAPGHSKSLPSEDCALERDKVAVTQSRPAESTDPLKSLAREADILAEGMVMVKVASKACHSMLLLPDQGLLWSLDLYGSSPEFVARVLRLVSGSLYAIYKVDGRDTGLVQLMPDLLAAGYLPLRPRRLEKQGRLKDMCQAFERLIRGTLVPLALLGVVHADLRAGYLETANVLCHKDDLTMRLIDLDSLIKFDHWKSLLEDPRIISPQNGPFAEGIKSEVEFVCLQVVCLATAWLKGKQIEATTDEDARSALAKELTTEKMIEQYLGKRLGLGANVDRDTRRAHFSIPRNEACSFVLREVRLILKELLGESPD